MARVKVSSNGIELIRSSNGDVIPSRLKSKELEKSLRKMSSGDEAIVRGHIAYEGFSQIEGPIPHQAIFIIESIKPISLKSLGKMDSQLEGQNLYFPLDRRESYSPQGFPVTKKVASAITLTAAALLLQSLTSHPNQTQELKQLDSGILLSAGIFATGLFIYEQITDTHSGSKKSN